MRISEKISALNLRAEDANWRKYAKEPELPSDVGKTTERPGRTQSRGATSSRWGEGAMTTCISVCIKQPNRVEPQTICLSYKRSLLSSVSQYVYLSKLKLIAYKIKLVTSKVTRI